MSHLSNSRPASLRILSEQEPWVVVSVGCEFARPSSPVGRRKADKCLFLADCGRAVSCSRIGSMRVRGSQCFACEGRPSLQAVVH